jgi:DNA-binding beta-propeller fold protein YncE
MKRFVIAISLMMVILAIVSLVSGRAQEASAVEAQAGSKNETAANPLKVALLKWYPANLTTHFNVGKTPAAFAFDGANIWVSNSGDNTVSKLQPSDGTILGTFNAGEQPIGLVFDGANIWAANSYVNTVTKLRASDGKTLGTFAVGKTPKFLAFDGDAIWVTNTQGASITKLRAIDGKTLGTFSDDLGVVDIAFDGTYMWVTNVKNTVTRFKQDGTQAGTFNVGPTPTSLTFDGEDVFVAAIDGTVTKLRASDGQVLANYNAGNADGSGMAFDGQNLWLTGGPYIVEMRPSDGAVLLQKRLHGGLAGVGFDGADVWVAGYIHDIVYKL